MADPIANETRRRAAHSGGASDTAIYQMVERALGKRDLKGDVAVDLGCGTGALQNLIRARFKQYIGVDAVRYDGFPSSGEFIEADLNAARFPMGSNFADAVFAVETIEHLENPRALMREMVRIAKPHGWVLVTTPNQLSALSLGTLLVKRRFSAFQDSHYPAHITALLESDLLQIAAEVGLTDVAIEYSQSGRIALSSIKYPRFVSRILSRFCSDNILLIGRAP
jgi:SAM-dependent methyltransferase